MQYILVKESCQEGNQLKKYFLQLSTPKLHFLICERSNLMQTKSLIFKLAATCSHGARNPWHFKLHAGQQFDYKEALLCHSHKTLHSNCCNATHSCYNSHLQRYSYPLFGRARFSEITPVSVNRALANLIQPDPLQSKAVDVRSELDLRIGKELFIFSLAYPTISYGN